MTKTYHSTDIYQILKGSLSQIIVGENLPYRMSLCSPNNRWKQTYITLSTTDGGIITFDGPLISERNRPTCPR